MTLPTSEVSFVPVPMKFSRMSLLPIDPAPPIVAPPPRVSPPVTLTMKKSLAPPLKSRFWESARLIEAMLMTFMPPLPTMVFEAVIAPNVWVAVRPAASLYAYSASALA